MQKETHSVDNVLKNKGPFMLLSKVTKLNSKIIISSNDNHKFYGFIRGFDKHCNLMLEDVTEIWKEETTDARSLKKKVVIKEKFIPKLFFRGDAVILITIAE
ncbi:mRNA splicing factor (nucleomorph) [Bigelowiella natans]|uniref:Small nuclear ribonucleoprotein Sm D2 n=1 Tax=Bigelowiella natans TaxID=227086 RepID=Q3LVZ4_BIGNA|nr:mRNA splicing factor [Bigelowiella natans]ABA27372.1 mRNA splicing factor [Bigelowiella natans]|mmetsp:Transcript_29386/g.47130  ORF Transcript_29386/g.47130 Transcript_29386/m.47130 type:complete len:102 (+) Transcript_29386:103-408(+)